MTFEKITALCPGDLGREVSEDVERTVAVAGGDDEAVMGLVAAGQNAGISFILVGDGDAIETAAANAGADLSGSVILEPEKSLNGSEEGICREAVRLCAQKEAALIMKGHVGTAAFTRAILDKEDGLTGENELLSHLGLFADPRDSRPFLLTDAAINIAPDLEAKKRILSNAVQVARTLGISVPRIALLAPVEKVNEKILSTVDAAALADWVNSGGLGNAVADGPFALDVAASAEAARIKGLKSSVAGRTDIYLVPNLDAGNVFFKSLTVFAGAKAAGILAGASVPVVLTSRSDSEKVKRASLGFALTVAAQGKAG